jgi:ribose/xylose/arabinose/galactoside ABC-type transport system permease subunit
MATIARFLARRIAASQAESDVLKQLALLAFAGLLTAFLLVSYGLDLSAGFF